MANKQEKKRVAEVLAKKRKTRRLLTLWRMIRYGASNFTRNAWLTIAATAVMTVTLLIVFATVVSRGVLLQTIDEVSRKVDISLYLKNDTPTKTIDDMMRDLRGHKNVREVSYVDAKEARKEQIKQQKDQATLEALSQATNKLPATIRIQLKDVKDTSSLEEFTEHNSQYRQYKAREASFKGERSQALDKIKNWVAIADRVGLAATVVFIVISSLIVFNTIRMAIFTRKEEISMMKLIGADRNFIRGPFIVEASMYGFIAGIIATVIGIALMNILRQPLKNYGFSIDTMLNGAVTYLPLVVLGIMAIGVLIGVVSSYFATRKYLNKI